MRLRVAARAASILVVIAFLAAFPTGCGDGPGQGVESRGDREVRLYNWKDFTDEALLEGFEADTGITVYLNEFKTGEEMIASLQSAPGTQDLVVGDSDDLELYRQLRIIEELDPAGLPGLAGLKEYFQVPRFTGPQGMYGVPYLWGTTGLIINTSLVRESIDSWNALWDPRYAGKIALLDDTRDAMMAVLKSCGYSASTTDPEELRVAEEKALRLKENGVVFGETFDNIEKVMSGELWMAEA
jgi:spermidine/putrescine-binding protein